MTASRPYIIMIAILCALFMVACKKVTTFPYVPMDDYRRGIVGYYGYDLKKTLWGPGGEITYKSGDISIWPIGDSCIHIEIRNSTEDWLCKVNKNKSIKLIDSDQKYKPHYYCDIYSPSPTYSPITCDLYISCGHGSLGAGIDFKYYCNRKSVSQWENQEEK